MDKHLNKIQKYWLASPLIIIIWIGFILRILAAIFSQGYAVYNDHFQTLELAQSWIDGIDYLQWLPKNQDIPVPTGNNLIYTGIHYVFLNILDSISITDPKAKALAFRFIHLFLSLIVIHYTYKIAGITSNRFISRKSALIIAVLWFMPFVSVRSMNEVAAIPFFMAGTYIYLKTRHSKRKSLATFGAGSVSALSVALYYPSILIILATALAIGFKERFSATFKYLAGFLFFYLLTDGLVNYVIWGNPFAEFLAFANNIVDIKQNTININNWYIYPTVLIGIFSVPLGIFYFAGFFIRFRRNLILTLPVITYLVVMAFLPNKEERFTLIIIPLYTVAAIIGWDKYTAKSVFWKKNHLILKISMWIFIIFNIILAIPFTFGYSKKADVEAMVYLSQYSDKINYILIEDSNNRYVRQLPAYYLGKPVTQYILAKNEDNTESVFASTEYLNKTTIKIFSFEYFKTVSSDEYPDFLLFYGPKNIEERISAAKNIFIYMSFEKKIEPSFFDRMLSYINPLNRNPEIFIYRTSIE